MAPSRRASNGRSPLVNPQRQITAFFTPGKSPITPPPSISFKDSPSSGPSANPSPPSETKQKKPLLVVSPSPVCCSPNAAPLPESRKKPCSAEVVGKRIKVYWPLDKCWYDGCVKSFDEKTGKHAVQYDDAEEEVLDLREEKIEWVEEAARSLRRLRRTSVSVKPIAVEKEAADGGNGGDNESRDSSGDDDSMDDDWEKNGEEEVEGDDDDCNDLVVELDEDDEEVEILKASPVGKSGSRKRKSVEEEKSSSGKKSRAGENVEKNVLKVLMDSSGSKADQLAPSNAERGSIIHSSASILTVDAAERFGKRETEKLGFLGLKRKDAAGRPPGDLNYDPRTLFLPPSFLKSLSGGQRQWWEFKSKHMDKVLLFKMGKFYELFEMDAHIGTKELDLQYMKGEQPHCGFPEKNFAMNVEKLARKGYRVLVVEQTETPEQLELRRKETGCKDKVVKREVCAIVTKGTLTEGEMLSMNPDSSYLMSLTDSCCLSGTKEENVVLGVCFVDVSTSRFIVGQFADDAERHCLSSILSELRPVEIIKPARVLSSETQRVVQQHTRNPVINDLVPLTEFWDAEKTVQEVTKVYKVSKDEKVPGTLNNAAVENSGVNESRCLPDVLSELVNAGENGTYALSALGGCLFYLRQAFLDESLLKFAKFELLPCSGLIDALQKPYLVLDSAALENLEILENNINGGSSGSLFSQLDHCVTAFGKRLLKSWLARPLYHRESIVKRQDAIASLKVVAQASALDFRKELSRLPDMERLLARLFASSNANGRNANRVILYEDASRKLLKEFLSALRGCELMACACSSLSTILDNTDSDLLHQLLTPGKCLPDICSNLKHFKDAFDWSEADSSGRIVPHEGVDKEYDSACKVVEDVKLGLSNHLKDQHKLLGDKSVKYVTVGKDEYLLEVPEILQAKIPREYELQSSKKGYFRYWTPKIKKYLAELSQAKDEKESKLKSILQRLIGHFCEHHTKWRQLVSATAELDALISLAVASDYYEGPACRPTIIDISCSSEASPSLAAKNLGHPVLRTESLGKCSFVLNDVNIGGAECPSFILLTGPNMGGKSTLLRQICLAVILAQIGADVPAECFELSPADRIFIRMGARDHIMAGQSTFLTELSETATMLLSATNNSLVALDELGRGTSTSDGQAIAESVLQHFVSKIRCRGIFSTHYHRLAVDYEKHPQVSLCHMACLVGKGVGGIEEVTFLYKLTPGACPKSYGVNVARLAGLPASVLLKASAKSSEFEAAYVRNGQRSKHERYISGDACVAVQDVLHTLIASDYSESMGMELLSNMQKKVRVILKGH